MSRQQIAKTYIENLDNGAIDEVVKLFSLDGVVYSPIYGKKSAQEFYYELAQDTSNSELTINGIFEEPNTSRLALYFNYKWTLQNGTVVVFDVVDIITFNDKNKIVELRIIYDTKNSRNAVELLNGRIQK